MDLYVERQCVEQMKAGEARQFLLLFDAYFPDLYRYVARRVGEGENAEAVVRYTFLDALGQVQNTPADTGYQVWLYALARPRVVDYIEKNGFPKVQGVIAPAERLGEQGDEVDVLDKAERTFCKLSLEEREILRLKFFEEVADGDVMTVLGIEDGTIGPQIYRVLKRAHFLLFGESDERQGVYFGELSGFLARLRELEDIKIPEAFRLSLRADLSGRIDRRDFAIEAEAVLSPKKPPVEVKGSDDPAKIFVEAVKEMKEEENRERAKQEERLEKWESVFDIIDRWKLAAALVVLLVAVFAFRFVDFGGGMVLVERGHPNNCSVEVVFDGEFYDGEIRSINEGISDRICGHFEVESLYISKIEEGKVLVAVDASGWFLEYGFVRNINGWRIKKYERTPDSDQKSGEV